MSAQNSTNGRSTTFPTVPVPLRTALRVLERGFPALGAAVVERVWFTVPAVPEKARRLRVDLPPGRSFEVRFARGVVRGTSWGTGRTVYLVHGWGGWGLQLAAYVAPLVDAGFRVVAYDAPSHGASDPGRQGAGRSDLPELTDVLRAVVADQGAAYGVVAHSFGAAATTHAIVQGLTVQRAVFVAAPTSFDRTLDQFQQALGFGPRTRARFHRRFTRRFGRSLESFGLLTAIDGILSERELPPLLAVHDTDDSDTPSDGSVAIVAAWPGARLQLTEGLGHRKVLGDRPTVDSVVAFLSARPPASAGKPVGQDTMHG